MVVKYFYEIEDKWFKTTSREYARVLATQGITPKLRMTGYNASLEIVGKRIYYFRKENGRLIADGTSVGVDLY